MPDPSESSPVDFESLLPAAAREILRHEDPRQFFAWLQENVEAFAPPSVRDELDPASSRALAAALGPAIWNATPLPGNGLRPRPLPRPGRNDPCPCGSGRKFKRCCAGAPTFPPVPPELMWSVMLDALPAAERAGVLATGRVPVGGLAMHAQTRLEAHDPAGAASLLEPLFAGGLDTLDTEDHALALEVLANAYGELGHEDDEHAIVDRVIAEAARSPLRACAWQRLSVSRMGAGDVSGAWEAFEHARSDHPHPPSLARLEIVLLAAGGSMDEVPQRARFWIRRLRRQRLDEDDPLLGWLRDVAEDPEGVLGELAHAASDGAATRLVEWLDAVAGRALPAYRVLDEPADEDDAGDEDAALDRRLRAMGVPAGQIPQMIERMKAQAARDEDEDDEVEPPAVTDEGPPTTVLDGPPALGALEQRWHRVFPLDKPFSVHEVPFVDPGDADPWEVEDEWGAFLEAHPEAFDSLDVLDDLATALAMHPALGEEDFDRRAWLPVLERARAIVEHALENVSEPRLAWVFAENRPALRALVRLARWELDGGDPERGLAIAERVLGLDPRDSHGLRALVADEYLATGRDEDLVALAARYPEDLFPETRYGAALALYRLGRTEEARTARASAVEALPRVARYLVEKSARAPRRSAHGLEIGGDAQAWEYRDRMRPVWAATPGALEWLREAMRGKGRSGGKRSRRSRRRR